MYKALMVDKTTWNKYQHEIDPKDFVHYNPKGSDETIFLIGEGEKIEDIDDKHEDLGTMYEVLEFERDDKNIVTLLKFKDEMFQRFNIEKPKEDEKIEKPQEEELEEDSNEDFVENFELGEENDEEVDKEDDEETVEIQNLKLSFEELTHEPYSEYLLKEENLNEKLDLVDSKSMSDLIKNPDKYLENSKGSKDKILLMMAKSNLSNTKMFLSDKLDKFNEKRFENETNNLFNDVKQTNEYYELEKSNQILNKQIEMANADLKEISTKWRNELLNHLIKEFEKIKNEYIKENPDDTLENIESYLEEHKPYLSKLYSDRDEKLKLVNSLIGDKLFELGKTNNLSVGTKAALQLHKSVLETKDLLEISLLERENKSKNVKDKTNEELSRKLKEQTQKTNDLIKSLNSIKEQISKPSNDNDLKDLIKSLEEKIETLSNKESEKQNEDVVSKDDFNSLQSEYDELDNDYAEMLDLNENLLQERNDLSERLEALERELEEMRMAKASESTETTENVEGDDIEVSDELDETVKANDDDVLIPNEPLITNLKSDEKDLDELDDLEELEDSEKLEDDESSFDLIDNNDFDSDEVIEHEVEVEVEDDEEDDEEEDDEENDGEYIDLLGGIAGEEKKEKKKGGFLSKLRNTKIGGFTLNKIAIILGIAILSIATLFLVYTTFIKKSSTGNHTQIETESRRELEKETNKETEEETNKETEEETNKETEEETPKENESETPKETTEEAQTSDSQYGVKTGDVLHVSVGGQVKAVTIASFNDSGAIARDGDGKIVTIPNELLKKFAEREGLTKPTDKE